ncbi:MAG: glycoside hydrolase family 2 TIM barrel-domain containing protein, partial [Flavobacterium sp.]
WYRKYFKIEKPASPKRITLNFDGVQKNCEVYLNGEKLTTHYGGYIGFVIDITDKVKFNENNVLAVRVSSLDDPLTPPGRPQSKLDFYYYGGIYRNVSLTITNTLYISDPLEANKIAGGGLFVTFPKVSKAAAEIQIKTHVVNQSKAVVKTMVVNSIRNKEGIEVAHSRSNEMVREDKEFVQKLVVTKPKLWHPDHPYLYDLVTQIYNNTQLTDQKTTPIGIRSIAFKSPTGKTDGFYINGEKLYLRGANRHQCYQNIGDAAPASMQYRDALQLKKGGFNSVRASHYPQSPDFLDACDKIGLLVIECEPSWQFYNEDAVFITRTQDNVREMIRRDRNRPCIFLWETSLNESPTPDYWAKDIVAIAHQEMPNNQMFTADDFFAKGKKYYDVSYKVINEDATDPMPEMPSLTREWGDTWIADPAKEDGLRASRIYTEKGLINQCLLRQNALNGTMLEEEGGYWDHARLDANPRIGGYFLWSFNDVARGTDMTTAFCGVVDIDRYEKFGYYQLQSMQDARNPTYGPMVFIASYNNRADLDKDIVVFSNCDKVRLYRNSIFIKEITREENAKSAPFVAGKGGSPYFLFKTDHYQKGELKAQGILNGKVVSTHIVKTPEAPDHLEIEWGTKGINPIADGSDIIPFYVKVCDKNGTVISNVNPMETFEINLKVSGKGKLIGSNVSRIAIVNQQTESGIGYGMIRTSLEEGKIEITASSTGLKSAQSSINTLPFSGTFATDGEHAQWLDESDSIEVNTQDVASQAIVIPAALKITGTKIIMASKDISKEAKNLLDGNTATVWAASKTLKPVELVIDLGKIYYLQGSRFIWGKDSDWYTYSVAISENGTDWTNVIQQRKTSGQDYKPVLHESVKGKFIKIIVEDVQPENSKVAIKDIVFFGKE